MNPTNSKVAYLSSHFDLASDSVARECIVHDIEKRISNTLVNRGSPSNIRWLDDETIVLLKEDPSSQKRQIFLYKNLIGEGFKVTNHTDSIQSFEVFGNGFIFLSSKKSKKTKFGIYQRVEKESGSSGLYYVDLDVAQKNEESASYYFPEEKKRFPDPIVEITKLFNEEFTIESFVVSPKFDAVYLNCRKMKELHFENEKIHYRIQLDAKKALDTSHKLMEKKGEIEDFSFIGTVTKLELPSDAVIKRISPDGSKLLFEHKKRDLRDLTQADLWILDLDENEKLLTRSDLVNSSTCITNNLDQEPLGIDWSKTGIYVSFYEESNCNLAKIDETGLYEILDLNGLSISRSFFVSLDDHISFVGQSSTHLEDVFVGKKTKEGLEIVNIGGVDRMHSDWDFGVVESIRWKSKDGTEIEGILHKPSDFDASKKYPLLIQPHGGPHGVSDLALVSAANRHSHPYKVLCNKGILILQPNYRGSLGKGQSFKELLYNNIGVGDMWDIESGIDYLIEQGYVDENKIGSMGWSQGGFISAFLGIHSNKFAAVSVGAGVSTWHNYYIGSDLRDSMPLSGRPFSEEREELYQKTAPISGLKNANTPMLIQHGEKDQRTPIVNAKELHRALKEKGIHVEFFLYPEDGHNVVSPRNCYAILMQNYRWFCHYLLDEELEFEKYEF